MKKTFTTTIEIEVPDNWKYNVPLKYFNTHSRNFGQMDMQRAEFLKRVADAIGMKMELSIETPFEYKNVVKGIQDNYVWVYTEYDTEKLWNVVMLIESEKTR